MLSQLLLFFGFFGLVLVAVFWISRAVRLFDRLIADGQSTLVFLEFTALGLPRIILLVLPLASFAAAVYVTNRLRNESELTVMQATGSSPWRLMRPVFAFSVIVATAVAILGHQLVPTAMERLQIRENEVSQDATARFLTEGTFVHPSEGVTLYTREIDEDGVLKDVFLSDRRNRTSRIIYTAADAYIVRDGSALSLLMVDGLAQRYSSKDRRIATSIFQDFSYDISNMLNRQTDTSRRIRTVPTWEILTRWDDLPDETEQSVGFITEELHARIAQPFFAMATALFGFAVLISSGFTRFGSWREIVAAFALLLLLDSLRAALSDPIRDTPEMWPLAYIPTVAGFILAFALLGYSSRPSRFRRRVHA